MRGTGAPISVGCPLNLAVLLHEPVPYLPIPPALSEQRRLNTSPLNYHPSIREGAMSRPLRIEPERIVHTRQQFHCWTQAAALPNRLRPLSSRTIRKGDPMRGSAGSESVYRRWSTTGIRVVRPYSLSLYRSEIKTPIRCCQRFLEMSPILVQ